MESVGYDNEEALGTVEGKIKAIVQSMNEDVEYVFANWAQTNVLLDQVKRPTIVYVLPPSGTLTFSWHDVKDYPSSQIAFVCNTEYDFDGTENDGIIEAMKRLCVRFVRALNESGYFDKLEGMMTYQVLYDKLDVNVTGIVIEPVLKELKGIDLCSSPFTRKSKTK
jgi:hypothetical protein